MAVITLAGQDYQIGRFNIGELKRMTEVIDGSMPEINGNVVERSKLLVAIALERIAPDLKVDDSLETDMAELNAAAAAVIDLAGFVELGKQKAAAAAASAS